MISPVWIMNAGFCGIAATPLSASCNVAVTLGLAGLSNPRWLSLICAKVKLSFVAASALPIRRDRGTPPATVQIMAVPAHVMHFRKPRRCRSPDPVMELPFIDGPPMARGPPSGPDCSLY